MKSFRAAVRLLLGATIGLVVIGVIVRATDSGMGCPDWPLCYGQIIPPTTDSGDVIAYKAWLEWIHRAIAAMIGLIVLAVVALALRNLKDRRSLQGASIALLALVLFQAWLGRQTVLESNSGASVTAHLASAMAFVGLQVWVLARSGYAETLGGIRRASGSVVAPIVAAGAIYALLLFGSNVTGTDTGLLYPDWPLMGGTLFPPITELSTPMILHRYATAIVALILISALWIVRREKGSPARVRQLLTYAAAVFAVQCVIGAVQIFTKLAPWTQTLHVALATVIWILTVGAASIALLEGRVAGGSSPGGSKRSELTLRETIFAYVALTKPRIVELLLITTVPAMLLAAHGFPPLTLIAATLVAHAARPVLAALGRRPGHLDLLGTDGDRNLGVGRGADAVADIDRRLQFGTTDAYMSRLVFDQLAVEHVDRADEVGDEAGTRELVDLGRRPDLDDLALVHDADAGCQRHRFFLVVGDHDEGDAELLLQVDQLELRMLT